MISYTISDTFYPLKEFTLSLPDTFNKVGSIIQDSRNIVKLVNTPYGNVVIKNFKGMYFFNRLAYSLFRRSKASRSYLYADILRKNGIITPTNIAWVNRYTFGLLMESFYVSIYYPYPTLHELLNSPAYAEEQKRKAILDGLAAFAMHLHYLGIYHADFSTGNILVIAKDGGYEFGMVDLNRIRFGKVKYRKGLQCFDKLGLSASDLNELIGEYARLSDKNPETSIDQFWSDKKRVSTLRAARKKLRKYTLTPLEKMFSRAYLYLASLPLTDQIF